MEDERVDFHVCPKEDRLKSKQPDSAHVTITGPSKGKAKKFGKCSMQRNKSAYVTTTNKVSSPGTKGSSSPRCHFCKDKRHMRKECHKFKEWLEKKDNLSICICYESYTFDASLNTWWVDIGAIVHITNSLQEFLFVKKLNKGDRNVLVGNGEKAQVEAVGTLRLVLESGFNLDLVDTIYVPSMTRNLISVSRLGAYGYSFKFENKGLSLFLYSRVIGSGLLEGNLYKLLLNASFTEFLKTMNVHDIVAKTYGKRKRENENSAKLWHEHLGRISRDAEYSGSSTPRIINLEEIQDHVSIPVIQKVGASLPRIEDNNAPKVVPNDVPSIMDPAPNLTDEQPLRSGSKFIILVLYVEDILLASSDMHMLYETKKFMSKNFDVKDLGEASYAIGTEIHRDRSREILRLSQRAYIDKVLKRFNMHNYAPTVGPVFKGDKFILLQCPRNQLEQDEMERIPYASVVGSLMYAQVCTRPDIAYVIGSLESS
ncbi:hypothetical protein RJ639_035184 [Escallonia herrerae]|uniref:Reverse transcriptase Ty1/copia-type domain-containing protein n=1 Tax=Escallonia herrerae TaxID=1293975 RepID=A0AA88WNG6_9ASTE|nr:hypothetical protein RJ639_035184 [Escallonia herrerae]